MLNKLRQAGTCCLAHLEEVKDNKDYIFVIMPCHNCEDKPFCLRLKSLIEKELNKIEYAKTNKV